MVVLLRRNNRDLKQEEGLITADEFMTALSNSRDLCTEEKFIPLNLSLWDIIVYLNLFRTMLYPNL
jgi:hypothetical protein